MLRLFFSYMITVPETPEDCSPLTCRHDVGNTFLHCNQIFIYL